MKLYFGGYPNDTLNGICTVDFIDGKFKNLDCICQHRHTTYFDHIGKIIYSIASFENEGVLARIDELNDDVDMVSEGSCPSCYVTVSHHGDRVVTTNYHEGFVNIYDVDLNLIEHLDFGNDAKMHCAWFSSDDERLILVSLGLDQCFVLNKELKIIRAVQFPKGSGIRHVVSSKDEHYLYILSELSNEIFVLDLQTYEIVAKESILIEHLKSTSGAALRLSKDGKHLYASTRGQDLITHFVVDGAKLMLDEVYHCSGKNPRDFILTDDEKHVIVAYQDCDFVEAICLNEDKRLRDISDRLMLKKIVCVKEF